MSCEQVKCTGCSQKCGLQSSSHGTFSEGILTNYSNGANCEWMIAPHSAVAVVINFTEFSTQKALDTVRVSECTTLDCGTEKQLAVLSGRYAGPQLMVAGTGIMKVKFSSDARITGAGFTASWTSVGICFCTIINSFACMHENICWCNMVFGYTMQSGSDCNHSGRSSALVAARSAGYRLQIMVCWVMDQALSTTPVEPTASGWLSRAVLSRSFWVLLSSALRRIQMLCRSLNAIPWIVLIQGN